VAAISGIAAHEKEGVNTVSWRREQVRQLSRIASASSNWNKKIKDFIPASDEVRRLTRGVNVAFLCILLDAMHGYPDVSLPLGLTEGMQVLGEIRDSGVFRPVTPPWESQEAFQNFYRTTINSASNLEWLSTCSQRLARKAKNARKQASRGDSHALDLMRKVEESTLKEVQGGLMGPVMSRDELIARYTDEAGHFTARVIPRHGVHQGFKTETLPDGTEVEVPKLRCIDDARTSLSNRSTYLHETIACPTFELPAQIADCLARTRAQFGLAACDMLLSLDDLFSAYRRVPTKGGWHTVVACYSVASRTVVFHDVYGIGAYFLY